MVTGDEAMSNDRRKSLLEFALPVTSLVVTALLGIQTFELSRRTGEFKQRIDTFETDNKKYSVITDLLQRCTSDSTADKNYVLFLVRNKERFDLAAANLALRSDDTFRATFQNTLQTCFDWASNGGSTEPADLSFNRATAKTPVPPERSTSEGLLSGPDDWVYLGTFDGHTWTTRYLDFPMDFDPRLYIEPKRDGSSPKEFAVRRETGDLYLRSGSFAGNGGFPPITGVLKPGAHLELVRTWPWSGTSNNWWAVVKIRN